MKRPALWLWCSAGLAGVALVVVFGGWWSIRRWPYEIGPHLPPSLAIRLATLGEKEFKAAELCFFDNPRHPMSAAQVAACNAALCQGLRNSRDEQLVVLHLLYTHFEDTPIPATPERDALVFACTTSDDPEVRALARLRWTEGPFCPTRYLQRTPIRIDDNDRSPLSPDHWIAGYEARIAWRMMAFVFQGYDHVTPSRHAKHLRAQLDLLLSREDGHGRFAADERDHAIVTMLLAELFSMTNDVALRPVVERAAAVIGNDRSRLERLWQDNTTAAVLSSLCSKSLLASGIPADHLRVPLQASFAAWKAGSSDGAPPRWYAQGKEVEASAFECWGLVIAGDSWCGGSVSETAHPMPPTQHVDPAVCTPFGRFVAMYAALMHSEPRLENLVKERQRLLNDTMIITPDHRGAEGSWPAHGEVSAEWETVFNVLELWLYWRLRPQPPP